MRGAGEADRFHGDGVGPLGRPPDPFGALRYRPCATPGCRAHAAMVTGYCQGCDRRLLADTVARQAAALADLRKRYARTLDRTGQIGYNRGAGGRPTKGENGMADRFGIRLLDELDELAEHYPGQTIPLSKAELKGLLDRIAALVGVLPHLSWLLGMTAPGHGHAHTNETKRDWAAAERAFAALPAYPMATAADDEDEDDGEGDD